MALRTRFALTWAECLEGLVTGDETWSLLARCRARLLATWFSPETKTQEMRGRLKLWEQGRVGSA
eukprot:6484395-Karenia_brevis.AAC.1